MITVNEDEIYFAKIRPTAIVPTKKDEDAGYDVYADFEEDFFVINPHQSRAIPTGIATAFSSSYYAQIEERSSMAKMGIKKSGGVFDSGYRGEYFIVTYNTHDIPFIISAKSIDDIAEEFEFEGVTYKKSEVLLYPKTKAICQIVMHVIPKLASKELSYEDLKSIESERKTTAFGASGK